MVTTIASNPSLRHRTTVAAELDKADALGAQPITCLDDIFKRQHDILYTIYLPPDGAATKGPNSTHWDSALSANSKMYDAAAGWAHVLDRAWGITHRTFKIDRPKPRVKSWVPFPFHWRTLSIGEKVECLKVLFAGKLYIPWYKADVKEGLGGVYANALYAHVLGREGDTKEQYEWRLNQWKAGPRPGTVKHLIPPHLPSELD